MLNQFLKALVLVIITAATTYAVLTFLPENKEAKELSQTSSKMPLTEKNLVEETAEETVMNSTQADTSLIDGDVTSEMPAADSTLMNADISNLEKSINDATLAETEQNIPSPSSPLSPPSIDGILPSTEETHSDLNNSDQTKQALSKAEDIDNTNLAMSTIEDEQESPAVLADPSQVEITRPELADKKAIFEFSTSTLQNLSPQEKHIEDVQAFCKELADKLRTVKYKGCLKLNLGVESNFKSVKERSLTYRHFRPQNITESVFDPLEKKTGRILFISGIHGDEYSAISITYLWMLNMLKHQDKNTQHWLFLPLTNPDGLFKSPATRINANNVDLNRNFPSPDWDELALDYWKNYYKRNKRRYPGEAANSEPETQWLVHLIEEFKPDAIISVHAPYGLVDYDGPEHAIPNRIGGLKHRELGTYPGSLGRYAGEYLKIPVLTLELRAAGSMPSNEDIYNMWRDVEEWTITKIRGEDPGPIPNFNKVSKAKQ